MKRSLSFVALMGIALGTVALAGCESTPNSTASNADYVNPAMSGGNGMFGENPVRPGAYSPDREASAPTTRPAAFN